MTLTESFLDSLHILISNTSDSSAFFFKEEKQQDYYYYYYYKPTITTTTTSKSSTHLRSPLLSQVWQLVSYSISSVYGFTTSSVTLDPAKMIGTRISRVPKDKYRIKWCPIPHQ
jgi:hypothetical protein